MMLSLVYLSQSLEDPQTRSARNTTAVFLHGHGGKMDQRRIQLDEIDIRLLNRIRDQPGISITDAIEPLLNCRSETSLRRRIRQYKIDGRITFKRTRHEIQCYPLDPKAAKVAGHDH